MSKFYRVGNGIASEPGDSDGEAGGKWGCRRLIDRPGPTGTVGLCRRRARRRKEWLITNKFLDWVVEPLYVRQRLRPLLGGTAARAAGTGLATAITAPRFTFSRKVTAMKISGGVRALTLLAVLANRRRSRASRSVDYRNCRSRHRTQRARRKHTHRDQCQQSVGIGYFGGFGGRSICLYHSNARVDRRSGR